MIQTQAPPLVQHVNDGFLDFHHSAPWLSLLTPSKKPATGPDKTRLRGGGMRIGGRRAGGLPRPSHLKLSFSSSGTERDGAVGDGVGGDAGRPIHQYSEAGVNTHPELDSMTPVEFPSPLDYSYVSYVDSPLALGSSKTPATTILGGSTKAKIRPFLRKTASGDRGSGTDLDKSAAENARAGADLHGVAGNNFAAGGAYSVDGLGLGSSGNAGIGAERDYYYHHHSRTQSGISQISSSTSASHQQRAAATAAAASSGNGQYYVHPKRQLPQTIPPALVRQDSYNSGESSTSNYDNEGTADVQTSIRPRIGAKNSSGSTTATTAPTPFAPLALTTHRVPQLLHIRTNSSIPSTRSASRSNLSPTPLLQGTAPPTPLDITTPTTATSLSSPSPNPFSPSVTSPGTPTTFTASGTAATNLPDSGSTTPAMRLPLASRPSFESVFKMRSRSRSRSRSGSNRAGKDGNGNGPLFEDDPHALVAQKRAEWNAREAAKAEKYAAAEQKRQAKREEGERRKKASMERRRNGIGARSRANSDRSQATIGAATVASNVVGDGLSAIGYGDTVAVGHGGADDPAHHEGVRYDAGISYNGTGTRAGTGSGDDHGIIQVSRYPRTLTMTTGSERRRHRSPSTPNATTPPFRDEELEFIRRGEQPPAKFVEERMRRTATTTTTTTAAATANDNPYAYNSHNNNGGATAASNVVFGDASRLGGKHRLRPGDRRRASHDAVGNPIVATDSSKGTARGAGKAVQNGWMRFWFNFKTLWLRFKRWLRRRSAASAGGGATGHGNGGAGEADGSEKTMKSKKGKKGGEKKKKMEGEDDYEGFATLARGGDLYFGTRGAELMDGR